MAVSRRVLIPLLTLSACVLLMAQDDAMRSITPEKFLNARPSAAAKRPTEKTAKPPAAPSYRRVARTGPAAAAVADTVEIGVTVWRLRLAKPNDTVRLLVQDPQASTEWTPERIAVGTPLLTGDRVRIAVESPRSGFLYVIDREQYADGTEGPPHLIFPTSRTRGGDNSVTGGRLIEIPSQEDRPPFFTLRPSRPDQIGERLTLIVTEQRVPEITVGEEAAELPAAVAKDLEDRGAGAVERFELVDGAGRTWSRAEQNAGSDRTRLLRQDDPLPQTLFRVVVKRPDLVAVNVVLTHGKGEPR